ncbi:Two-component sensor histidine kinase, contains HisKA and HATPase domains [Xaviernesmea oryzae]|nr:Two-component sensor histidine kinase, contains HisKA and HATPase domains [Xaviernesmea oryzae]
MQAVPDFAAILHGMPQPYLVLDAGLVIVDASDAYLALTSRTRDDIVGRGILEAFPENPDAMGTVEQGPLEVSLRHVLATRKAHEMAAIQYDIPRPGGGFQQKFWTPVHTPVLGPDGEVKYIIQSPMDVTDSVLAAREADARLRVAHHAADLASWEYEPETDSWRRSSAVDRLFGFEPGQGGPVAAPFFAHMHPDDLTKVNQVVQSVMDSPDQTVMNFDFRILRTSGDVRYVASRGEVLRTSDGRVRIIGVMMDMTADREREAALAASVEQKDLLLVELNHRVKNTLQLVVSTLRLQARRLLFPITIEAFEAAISRVVAIISVHERLYRSENALLVDMAAHLRKLSLDILGRSEDVQVLFDIDPMELPTERAIPVSVVVNELLTVAVARNAGVSRVAISFKEMAGGKLELEVETTRSGPSADSSLTELARKIVTTMAAQLGGDFDVETSDTGFKAALVFPAKES